MHAIAILPYSDNISYLAVPVLTVARLIALSSRHNFYFFLYLADAQRKMKTIEILSAGVSTEATPKKRMIRSDSGRLECGRTAQALPVLLRFIF